MSRKCLRVAQPKAKTNKHMTEKVQIDQQSTWICRVCSATCLVTDPYCNVFLILGLQCYQSLYYYVYVNAFFFVEKDEGIHKLY